MGGEHGEGDVLVYLTLEDSSRSTRRSSTGLQEQARDHLRSREAVEAALGRPESYAHYERADLALRASVLAHGIAETQSFVDGNKRTALVAMLTFLEINGHRVSATDRDLLLRSHQRPTARLGGVGRALASDRDRVEDRACSRLRQLIDAPLRHPFLLAGQLAVAQAASRGRFEVGLGIGAAHLRPARLPDARHTVSRAR